MELNSHKFSAHKALRPLTVRPGEWLLISEEGEMVVLSDSLYKSLQHAPRVELAEAQVQVELPPLTKEARASFTRSHATMRAPKKVEEDRELVLLALTDEYQPISAIATTLFGEDYTDQQASTLSSDLKVLWDNHPALRTEIGGGKYRRHWAWKRRQGGSGE